MIRGIFFWIFSTTFRLFWRRIAMFSRTVACNQHAAKTRFSICGISGDVESAWTLAMELPLGRDWPSIDTTKSWIWEPRMSRT